MARQYKTVRLNGEKIYDYGNWQSRIALPDYCPKCHVRDRIYLSQDEDGMDILRCNNCEYNKLAPTIKQKEEHENSA